MKRLGLVAGLAWVSSILLSSCSDPIGPNSGSGGAAGSGSGGAAARSCLTGCAEARNCCDDHCVNLQNDPQNCGSCGQPCAFGEFCTNGACAPPPCNTTCSGADSCCGGECCAGNQLCCDPQGPIDQGPRCSTPNEHGTCPVGCAPLCICASPDTPIATPTGERKISSLRAGELVYSVDRGRLKAVPIVRTQRTLAKDHHVVRVVLTSGRILEISPRHPTATGQPWGELQAGDALDGVGIAKTELIPYVRDATYDILPASDTGTYFAAGVLIGSTLARSALHVLEPTTPASLALP